MTSLAFVDTETTGLDPSTEEVFDVAIIRDGVEHVFHLRPDGGTVARMHPKAAEVNRYFERINEPGWWWDDLPGALERMWELLDGAHIVGAVPDFDARFLTALYKREVGDVPCWHYHLIDIEAMAIGYLLGKYEDGAPEPVARELPWRSDDLSRACGVEPPSDDERHTALGDARWAYRWYRTLVGEGVADDG